MQKPKRYTITAALPYTNGPVHIGHLAGVYVPADIYSRYLRQKGEDVAFVCGSDEHGVPITIKAKKEGITPQQVVDKYNKIIKDSFSDFGITFDNYSRTSGKMHHETASDFFKKLYDQGDFIEETSQQYYDEAENQFLADRYITGTCPKCGEEGAYGDQCEKCGSTLSPTELINPKSALSGNVPVLKETKHWFLPLDKHEAFLREWILEGHKHDWKPNVYGQVKSWVDDGLRPRAVTRDLDWGIPVPVEGGEGKVLYVWFDAPIGYILIDFPGQQDVLRYTLTANAPESKDNDFTWKDFQARNNNELVAIFGNFINRVVVLTNKYYNGVVPAQGELTDVDRDTLTQLKNFPDKIARSIERYRFREALSEMMNLARLGNKYLADEEPWKLIKKDEKRVETVMNIALQIASALAVVSEPFLPFTSKKLTSMLNLSSLKWEDVAEKDSLIDADHQIGKAELLFGKIEDAEIQVQLDKLEATKKANELENREAEPQKETITFEDFQKMDIRIGTIIEAVKVKKAKKLLQLKVDTGLDVRTVVSGIAESFSPEEIIGKQVSVLMNLAPRKIRGVESEGMILMVENADGKLEFVTAGGEVPNGMAVN